MRGIPVGQRKPAAKVESASAPTLLPQNRAETVDIPGHHRQRNITLEADDAVVLQKTVWIGILTIRDRPPFTAFAGFLRLGWRNFQAPEPAPTRLTFFAVGPAEGSKGSKGGPMA